MSAGLGRLAVLQLSLQALKREHAAAVTARNSFNDQADTCRALGSDPECRCREQQLRGEIQLRMQAGGMAREVLGLAIQIEAVEREIALLLVEEAVAA